MEHMESNAAHSTHVRALFSGHAASFTLANSATLMDLVARINDAGGWDAGALTAIFLQFPRPRQS